MITNGKQNWIIGQTVRVGFLWLRVEAAIPTPGDQAPDLYILSNEHRTQLYKFTPHRGGLKKITAESARDLLEMAEVNASKVAAKAIEKAAHMEC